MDLSGLPQLAYREIFTSNFNLKEKLKLRLVCKQWRELIDLFGQESLAIWEQSFVPYQIKWPDSKERIDLNSQILNLESFRVTEANDDFVRIDIGSLFFQNLRRLCIFKLTDIEKSKKEARIHYALLNSLNQLKQLSSLYFESSDLYPRWVEDDLDEPLVLSLPNLSFLCFKNSGLPISTVLQTPNLKQIIYWPRNENQHEKDWDVKYDRFGVKLDFVYPDTIKHMKCLDFRYDNLRNLETLICKRVVLPFELKKFPYLKELSIYPNEEELPIVENLKKQRTFLGRDSLSISVYGCENLENENAITFGMIREVVFCISMMSDARLNSFDCDSSVRYYRLKDRAMYDELARSYPRMTGITMPWHFLLDYPALIDCFKGSIPANFFDKFTEIRAIIVIQQVEDEQKLIEFVKKSLPTRLVLKNVHFGKNFYDQLESVDSIECLTLEGDLRWPEYGFISKMKSLFKVMLESNRKFPLDFVLKAFRESVRFKQITFWKLNFGHVMLRKRESDFVLHLQYPCGENRVFSKGFYLNSEDELYRHEKLMKNFVE